MDQRFRATFNAQWSDQLYGRMCSLMGERLQMRDFGFPLAETPLFLPPDLRVRCERAAHEILEIIRRPRIIAACERAIPPRYHTPRRDSLPHFLIIDLAIVREPDGSLGPRLIELQGFSSLYGMELFQSEVWADVLAPLPGMPRRWTALFGGLDHAGYVDLLRRTVIGDADPDQVILLDVEPEQQKTVPDFHAIQTLLGVRSVCITDVRKEGRRLLAPGAGKGSPPVPVRRIFHRVVFDELERRGIEPHFDYRDDLDVVWVAHPTWYWIWSKVTLPLIDHPAVPSTRVLSDVMDLPEDLSRFILKPLFSFAGLGVEIDLDRSQIEAIPPERRGDYLLQEKVAYAPALVTPDGLGVKAELRMMFLHPDGADDLRLAINLVRLSRGKMHGVDHNKGLNWVGSTVAIWPADDR